MNVNTGRTLLCIKLILTVTKYAANTETNRADHANKDPVTCPTDNFLLNKHITKTESAANLRCDYIILFLHRCVHCKINHIMEKFHFHIQRPLSSISVKKEIQTARNIVFIHTVFKTTNLNMLGLRVFIKASVEMMTRCVTTVHEEAQCFSSSPPSLSLISWQSWVISIKSAAALYHQHLSLPCSPSTLSSSLPPCLIQALLSLFFPSSREETRP